MINEKLKVKSERLWMPPAAATVVFWIPGTTRAARSRE